MKDDTSQQENDPISEQPPMTATSGDGDHDAKAAAKNDGLARVPSGPAYTVFSPGMRRWLVLVATCAGFVSPMTATIYFPAINALSSDLRVSIGLINLTLTTYMIFQAVAPTFAGDFGDMTGRRPALIVVFGLYLCANIGLALQRDYAALLVLRMLQSAGGSGTIALAFALTADITTSADRGKYLGIVGCGVNVGPTLGPVLGGILTQYFGWPAIFWFCAIVGAFCVVTVVMAVPETCRNVVGNGSIPAQRWNRPLLDLLRRNRSIAQDASPSKTKLRFPNPLRAVKLVFEKEMFLVLFYSSILYLCFIIVAATLATTLKDIHGFSDLQLGLCYLPYGAGCCIASVGQGYLLDWNYRRIARKIGFVVDRRRGNDLLDFPIERARMQPLYPALAFGIASLIAYGWSLHFETNVAVTLVLLFAVGLCIVGSFGVMNTMTVDLNPKAPATAMAAMNLVRCLMGAVGTAVIDAMLTRMGRGWTFTFWALLAVALSPMMLAIERRGPRWRREKKEKEDRTAQEAAG